MDLLPDLRIITSALCDISYAVVVGVLLNRVWLRTVEAPRKRLQLTFIIGSLSLLISVPAQLLLLSASMTGDVSWSAAWQALPDVMQAHTGHWLLLSFYAIPLLLALSLVPRTLKEVRWATVGIVLVAASLICRAQCGHAAADGSFTLRELMQFLHLSAINVWGGGVITAGLITVPYLCGSQRTVDVVPFARRLSNTVTWALLITFITGLYNAWKGLAGSLAGLPHTPWGRMLLIKVSIVALVICHGARVRLLLKKTDDAAEARATRIRPWLLAEAALMLCVFASSAWLANLPPADM
jgi:copper resistance protein D